jgi:hypothetical protein
MWRNHHGRIHWLDGELLLGPLISDAAFVMSRETTIIGTNKVVIYGTNKAQYQKLIYIPPAPPDHGGGGGGGVRAAPGRWDRRPSERRGDGTHTRIEDPGADERVGPHHKVRAHARSSDVHVHIHMDVRLDLHVRPLRTDQRDDHRTDDHDSGEHEPQPVRASTPMTRTIGGTMGRRARAHGEPTPRNLAVHRVSD